MFQILNSHFNLDENKIEFIILNTLNSIPASVLSIVIAHLHFVVNSGIRNSTVENELKLANITHIHKKDDTFIKSNFHPVSILPVVLKIFECVMPEQMGTYLEDI